MSRLAQSSSGASARPLPSIGSSGVSAPWFVGGALVAVVLAFILVYQIATWGKIAPGVTVLGTSVGGLSEQDARAHLQQNVDLLLQRPLQLRHGDRVWNTTARDLGLRLAPADLTTLAFAVGRDGHPVDRLGQQVGALFRGHTIDVAGKTDQAALDASLQGIAREIERAPRDARLKLNDDGTVEFVTASTGLTVDVTATRERVSQALVSATPQVDLVVRETPPAVGTELVQPAREQLDRILAGGETPLTLTFGNQSWPVERAAIVKLLSVEGGAKAGQPATVVVDEKPLRALAQELASEINQPVREARFLFNGGDLKPIRESREGRTLDQAATVDVIKGALQKGERQAAIPVEVVKPAVSSENPAALGIVELIDRGSTSFAGGLAEKKQNIRLAAERLNGVVVPPGGTFSFNKEVGPTTLEAGYQWGFGIASSSDGGAKTVPSVAGGICQVATTLFQPVFWSGYQLEERYWHLYWIPSYASRGVVGLDATVDEESGLDFKWVNPTDDYVLIQSATDEDTIYFALYGKKPKWKVEVDEAQITNRQPPDPRPVAEPEPSLPWGRNIAVESAREGFDVTVTRRVIPAGGGEPRVLNLRSTYQPSRTVTLVGTAGKPANASLEDALARVTGTQKPATETKPENKPVGDTGTKPEVTPEPTKPAAGTPAPKPTAPAKPAAEATPAPTPAAKPTSAPAKPTAEAPAAKPTAEAKPAPTKTP